MPGFDRTGPEGSGARTGRQLGKCSNKDTGDNGKEMPSGSEARRSMGRGMGRGMGRSVGKAARNAARHGQGRGAGRGTGRSQGGNSWHN